jgi:hypothetical protein
MDTCVAASLGYILNILDGFVIDIEPCDQPRAHQVVLRHAIDSGIRIEGTADVCDAHELLLSAHPGYVKSIGLRRTTQGR